MQEETGGEAPCFAHLLQPDAQTRRDVARWRRAERARLIAARQALPVAARRAADAELARRLDTELGELAGRTIAAYWPFRGEPDLRDWAGRARGRGARLVLPVVVGTGRPLAFRLWQPGATLERGVWDIPVPPATAPELRPDVLLVPVVGLDAARNRLG
ncbi:MAG: 5-formyltetrahydrofolate cyclo-ligase [Pseudodonghicola sp.]